MESGNGGASSEGVLIPVPDSSDGFQNSVLAPLQSAYLYEESRQFFRYKSAVLVKNAALEEKYNAFRAKRREAGYSEEDLKESYGFLLFDDASKANALGETGVLTGNSTCTTLGDPSKGVYISMYSDCLDLNRWYHGKSGYIAIIRLTKGKVKKVLENYTQNFTAPTAGFDCHVSEELPSVSDKTSSFLAFERTQYYMYELLDDGSNKTAQSPSAACPFAIVSFSYTDTKATLAAPQEKSEVKKLVCHYLPWTGQLQIGSQLYSVGLRSAAGALIPTKLPAVVKVERAISMSDVRQLLPKAVFETCFTGEAFLDGLYCSLCELVPHEAEETSSLGLLLLEIEEKDLALTVPLNDGGFLILLHSSHFLTYDDAGSSATEVLQGVFVFPHSRVVGRDAKFGQRKPPVSAEVLRVLPVLSYAEGETEKTPLDPSEELCEVLVQHMQSYAALINPGLELSPSREVCIFPDQYDVPDAHKHLYSSPEWTNRAWQSLTSYLSNPASLQLSVSKASEILMAGQEERREDLDDDVYICLSSPEGAPASPVGMGLEDKLSYQDSPVNVETSVDSGVSSTEAQVDFAAVPQNVAPDDLEAGDAVKDNETCSDLTELIKTDDMEAKCLLTHPTSDDLPTELIVSITSAERSVTDETLSAVSVVSTTKHNDFEFSGFSTRTKLPTAEVVSGDPDRTKKVLDCPEVASLTRTKQKMKQRKLFRGLPKARKTLLRACVEANSLRSVRTPVEDEEDEDSSDPDQMNNPSNIDWRRLQRRKRKLKLSTRKMKRGRPATVGLAVAEEKKPDLGQQSLESTILMELEACPLRKKTERWDLKPVISECGRILVPHGSIDIANQIKSLKDKLQSAKDEQCPEKMLPDAPVNAQDTVRTDQESSIAPETAVDKTETTQTTDGRNHLQSIVSHVDPEQSILRQLDGSNSSVPLNPESNVLSSKDDDAETPPSQAEECTDTLTPEKLPTKGEFLLKKLKSVLLRGKRKTDLLSTEETTASAAQDCQPCLKKGKVGSDTEALERNNATTPDTNVEAKDVSEMLSVDPIFAFALGLTPKESPEQVQKTEEQDTQQGKDSADTQEPTVLDKQPQIIHRPPSIFPRRCRIKTLKKHQGISAEYIKKKWWLHFQTPACFASEKLNNKDCTRDNSVRKTVQQKMKSACSSTDALTLLADLALNTSNDQIPPQPNPALERKPETSLKKVDLTKQLTSAEQESVLHALLRQPAARSLQPVESPSPSHLVGDSELVDLVSKEHAYSLPPSSSLLLGLPGTPFQVSPVSGSARLLHHHQTLYGDGNKTLHLSVGEEDRSEHNHRTPEYLKKFLVRRQKFRYSRTFDIKEGSVQVTRQWHETYDFNLDSKFSSDSKDKAIVRALHGPWDFTIQDTSEEVRLIVHMWIGLFYSRSTDRFFHVDSNFTHPCSEERDSLEMPSGLVSDPAKNDLKANSSASTSDPLIPKALDLRKKDNTALDHESVILDLSLRNSNTETGSSDAQAIRGETSDSSERKEACEILTSVKSPAELHDASTFQGHRKMVHSTDIIPEVKDVGTIHGSKTGTTPQKAVCLEHTDAPSLDGMGRDGDGTFIPPQEDMKSVSVEPQTVETAMEIDQKSHGCKKESTDMKDGTENSEATEMSLVQKDGMDSFKSVTNQELESNIKAGDVVHTKEHEKVEYTDGKSCEIKENLYQEGQTEISLKGIHTGDDSADKESDIICNGYCSGNEKILSREEPEAASPDQAEPVDGHEGEEIKDGDHFGEEDGPDENDSCISAAEVDRNLSDQPLPMLCEGPDLVKKDCIAECNHHSQMDEQPPPADGTEDVCRDVPLKMLCANGSALTDECAMSGKASHTPSDMESTCDDSAARKNSEAEDNGTKSTEEKVDTPQKEPFQHRSDSPQCEEAEVAYSTETHPETDGTITEFDKSYGRVVIPFIGVDTSGEDMEEPHGSHPQETGEEVAQRGEEIPFISDSNYPEAALPSEVCSTSQISGIKAELSCKIPLLDVSESDNRCPTPTVDEKPYEYIPGSSLSSSSSAFGGSETCKNNTQKCLSRSSVSVNSELPFEQNLRHTTPVNSDPNTHRGLPSDLERRTQRVLESIHKFLSQSNNADISHQFETAAMMESLDQTRNLSSKYIPTSPALRLRAAETKDNKISNEKPAAVSASTSQDLRTESSDHFLLSPFKNKLEEVLGVKLQLKKTDASIPQRYFGGGDKHPAPSAGQDYGHPHRTLPSTGCLQVVTPNTDQDSQKTASQCSLNPEPRSYSQRPVMAVKPSKSDESQTDCFTEDAHIESSAKHKQTKKPAVTYTTATSVCLEKSMMGNSEGLSDDKHAASEFSSKKTWLPNVGHSKSNSNDAKFALPDPSYRYPGRDISKFSAVPSSSLSVQSFESATSSPKLVDGNHSFLTYSSVEKVGQTTKENTGMNQKDCSGASGNDNGIIDDSPVLGPQSSLVCTVYNTRERLCNSFLEQLTQRCLQDDLTQTSMEQECLIFSEKMKQLMKKSKRGPIHQEDTRDNMRLSCASPVTVQFSNLDEQEDSLDPLDASLVGQKIKVDMSDRKDLTNTTEEESPQGPAHPVELSGISDVTEEFARLYEATMHDICGVRKVPSRSKGFRKDRGCPKTQPSKHFDFCDQMKREMDETFRSNLNSVVKKSCKTKYRFYILVTSDDVFFKETKAQLEAEGHTAVQASEFFIGGDRSSSLLIILRNEDIAEHICEVPHLLELKRSPGVQFAGIDEPDDVVNLTHQELFRRGGFIMFDRAALELLSLCNMKKMSEILQQLSEMGKWKWMLHCRDSRRLKENARLSEEAKEKKQFLYWCQDAGILEVLPYHECDRMSSDQPDYLTCLVRLQVQNVSSRYPVFITDTTTDSAFERNGIFTMTLNSFLTKTPSEIFTV